MWATTFSWCDSWHKSSQNQARWAASKLCSENCGWHLNSHRTKWQNAPAETWVTMFDSRHHRKETAATVKPLMARRCEPQREMRSCLREERKPPTCLRVLTHTDTNACIIGVSTHKYMSVTPQLSSRQGNTTLSKSSKHGREIQVNRSHKNTPASLKWFCLNVFCSLASVFLFELPRSLRFLLCFWILSAATLSKFYDQQDSSFANNEMLLRC